MQYIGITLYNKVNEFLSVFAILVSIIMLFSGAAFMFLHGHFEKEEIQENICESWLRCFITYTNYGIRQQGPFGNPYALSYKNPDYIYFFLFDWCLFFFVHLITLNVINAIIVDSFQSLREENTKLQKKLKNFCFICNLPKINFQINGVDFRSHIKNEHNIKHYVNLLIRIYVENNYNLNSLQTSVKKLVEDKRVDFFPDRTTLSFLK